jgi:hypothetical protein
VHFSIIVHGPSAFEEDKWHTFTITHNYGTTLKFHYVMPRALCKVKFHSNCSALRSLFPQIFKKEKKSKEIFVLFKVSASQQKIFYASKVIVEPSFQCNLFLFGN